MGQGQSEQAGLYFGINDNRYVKVVWYSSNSGLAKVQTLFEALVTVSPMNLPKLLTLGTRGDSSDHK
jgi:hypothetical protein